VRSSMPVVERLTCPFCRSHLNPGAVACHGCGAVRGSRPVSYLLILIAFPLLAVIVTVTMFGVLGPDRMSAGGILLVFVCTWFGLVGLHASSRSQMHWTLPSVGAVHREGTPEIHRELADDKRCPQCAEMVKSAALKCRHCGFDFSPAADRSGVIDLAPSSDGTYAAPAARRPVEIWEASPRQNHVIKDSPSASPAPSLSLPAPGARRSLVGYLIGIAAVLGVATWLLAPDRDASVSAISASARTTPAPIPGEQLMSKPERERIAEVQRLLGQLGYEIGGADGVMGSKTRTAITQFRSRQGMPAGDIDRNFAAMLEAAVADKLAPKPKR
jgi:hypothetical protein